MPTVQVIKLKRRQERRRPQPARRRPGLHQRADLCPGQRLCAEMVCRYRRAGEERPAAGRTRHPAPMQASPLAQRQPGQLPRQRSNCRPATDLSARRRCSAQGAISRQQADDQARRPRRQERRRRGRGRAPGCYSRRSTRKLSAAWSRPLTAWSPAAPWMSAPWSRWAHQPRRRCSPSPTRASCASMCGCRRIMRPISGPAWR